MPEKISFSLVQLKSGVTPLTSPNIITQADLGTTTAVTNRAYVAVLGDGDTALEAGETGHVLSGSKHGKAQPGRSAYLKLASAGLERPYICLLLQK